MLPTSLELRFPSRPLAQSSPDHDPQKGKALLSVARTAENEERKVGIVVIRERLWLKFRSAVSRSSSPH